MIASLIAKTLRPGPNQAPDVAIGLAEAGTSHVFVTSGQTDLRKGVSEAKFDGQADFDVKKSPAPPKSAKNHEKPKKIREKISIFFFLIFFFDPESFETRFGKVLQVKNCETNCEKLANNCKKIAKNLRKFANF